MTKLQNPVETLKSYAMQHGIKKTDSSMVVRGNFLPEWFSPPEPTFEYEYDSASGAVTISIISSNGRVIERGTYRSPEDIEYKIMDDGGAAKSSEKSPVWHLIKYGETALKIVKSLPKNK